MLGFVNNDDLVGPLQLLPDGQHQVQLIAALRHLQRPRHHLQEVAQGADAGGGLDIHAGGGVLPHELLGPLGLADPGVTVDDDHALFNLAVADQLAHVLGNGGGDVVLGGPVGHGLFGAGLLLLLGAEELLQLAFQRGDVAVVVHTAPVLREGRLADPHHGGGLGLADALILQELLHPCLQGAVVLFTHDRCLPFVLKRFGS